MGRGSHKRSYYYAEGKRIELTPSPNRLAVRDDRESKRTAALRKVMDNGRRLSQGLVLIDCQELEASERQLLGGSAGNQPVFEFEDTFLVVLPEVRIEEPRPAKQRAVHQWLEKHCDELEYDEREPGRLTIRPTSNSGLDALDLAAQLNEQLHVEMAQPRFIRVTPRRPVDRGSLKSEATKFSGKETS